MLSRFDEYLIHQTPEPLAHPVSMDRNVYDRYWLGGLQVHGSFHFAISLGVYPNRDVMDCGVSLARAGRQRAFFGSRRAPADRADTTIGPFRLEVLEPMRNLRVTLAPNDSGLSLELTYRARSGCVEEDRQTLRQGHGTWMDVTRFTQFGTWEGWIRLDGETLPIEPAQVVGIRDRSWGRRRVGEPDAGAPGPAPQVFFLWAPLVWDDHGSLAVFFEDADGRPLHAEAKTVPLHPDPATIPGVQDPATEVMAGVSRELAYVPGTRRAREARLRTLAIDGTVRDIVLEPLMRFQMKGTGYGHPAWRHGSWKGELALGADDWALDALDPLAVENLHIQQLVRCRSGDRVGVGLLEQACVGPHRPSGFTRINDGAR